MVPILPVRSVAGGLGQGWIPMESVLHLGLPWRMLRPQLVSSLTDNKLAYKSWLENLAKEKLSQQVRV